MKENFEIYWLRNLKEHYADFNGRARRKQFWMFILFNVIFGIVFLILAQLVSFLAILSGLFSLAVLVPTIAVGVRRLHDIGKSGWFYLLILVPFANFWLIYLLATDSQPGTNEYGANPKEFG